MKVACIKSVGEFKENKVYELENFDIEYFMEICDVDCDEVLWVVYDKFIDLIYLKNGVTTVPFNQRFQARLENTKYMVCNSYETAIRFVKGD